MSVLMTEDETWQVEEQQYHVENQALKAFFEPILKEWLKLLVRYGEVTDDQAFWWTEVTNCSLLSTAAWKADRVSLTEFQHRKDQHKLNEEWDGRGDLYISDEANDYYLEAKQKRLSLARAPHRWPHSLRRLLDRAINAANLSHPREEAGDPIGIAFYTFVLHKRKLENINMYLAELSKCVETMPSIDGYAWYFPEKLRTKEWLYGDYLYPGTLLIMQRSVTKLPLDKSCG